MSQPDYNRIPAFYHKYIQQIKEEDLIKALSGHLTDLTGLLIGVPEDKWEHRYAEGKWSIKELVQHIIDAERIFSYRALTIARKDAISLPGFDENLYVINSNANKRTKDDLISEIEAVQRSSYTLFKSFDEEQLEQQGIMNGNSCYVAGIGYIIVGHCLHHKNILVERYLS